jgi:hypothetical protein
VTTGFWRQESVVQIPGSKAARPGYRDRIPLPRPKHVASALTVCLFFYLKIVFNFITLLYFIKVIYNIVCKPASEFSDLPVVQPPLKRVDPLRASVEQVLWETSRDAGQQCGRPTLYFTGTGNDNKKPDGCRSGGGLAGSLRWRQG